MKKISLTSWWEIKRNATARLGQEEFARRIQVAHQRARQIANDPAWFAEDEDREEVFRFMAWRLASLAVQLTDFAKFEASDHDTLGCIVVKMMEDGVMI